MPQRRNRRHRFGKTQLCQCYIAGASPRELSLKTYSSRSTVCVCLGLSSEDETAHVCWGKGRREGSHGHGCHPNMLQQVTAPTCKRVSTGGAFLSPMLWR